MPQRDANGRFISSKIKSTSSTSSPGDVPINPEFEKPIVSVTITNPLKKILYWLDQIRKHQTTTFAIKLSIPLIALPVLVFAAFQIGRGSVVLPFMQKASPTPTPNVKPSPTPAAPIPYSRSGTLKVAKTGTQTKYVLGLKNGENVLLEISADMDLSKYQNKLVLITGIYNRQANMITVTEIAEIELFNETTVTSPPPTGGPSPNEATPASQ